MKRVSVIFICAMLCIPIISMAQVDWVKDLDTALKQAVKENKFVVLDISASW